MKREPIFNIPRVIIAVLAVLLLIHVVRIYLLSEMVGRQASVADPIGGPLIEYENAAREINAYLTQGFERIIELATK